MTSRTFRLGTPRVCDRASDIPCRALLLGDRLQQPSLRIASRFHALRRGHQNDLRGPCLRVHGGSPECLPLMVPSFATGLDAACSLDARLLCPASFRPPPVGQGSVKQPSSPGVLATVARGKMLPPNVCNRPLFSCAQRPIDSRVSWCFRTHAPTSFRLSGSTFGSCEPPGHRVTARLTPCRELRFQRAGRIGRPFGTHGRGVFDHAPCSR